MKYLAAALLFFSSVAALPGAEPAGESTGPEKKLTILAVGAHMDDVENGIGGVLISAVKAGHRVVVVVAVSDYTTWAPTIGREAACKLEQLELAKKFGYEKRFLDYPYHQLIADNELKRRIAEIYVELTPDIAFVQNTDDHWPDHVNSGLAAKDAVLFAHGYTKNRTVRRCPRIFAYSSTPGQSIRFEPDFIFDTTPVMSEYMELIAGADSCLSGKPPEDLIQYEVRHLKTNRTLRLSGHGWVRHAQCIGEAEKHGVGTYGLGLKTLWGPRDGRPLW